jgi:hypothetical protein
MSREDDRRRPAKVLYDLEMALWEMGMSKLNYDEELECFRFPEDGRFAFSKREADWKLLEELDYTP